MMVLFGTADALAEGKPGGASGGQGGRLGQVSAGIATATSTAPGSGAPGASDRATRDRPDPRRSPETTTCSELEPGPDVEIDPRHPDDSRRSCFAARDGIARGGSQVALAPWERDRPGGSRGRDPQWNGHIAVQKVYESDGAVSGSLALGDGWLRIALSVQHYVERQERFRPLTLTMPSGVIGIRLDDRRATRAYLEGGAVYAWTRNDRMGDSSVAGPMVGVSVEHALASRTTLLGTAHAMYFSHTDVRAYAARLAVRYRGAELGFRALAFNVGPALYGPEVGIGF
jgi:hypothetical protein